MSNKYIILIFVFLLFSLQSFCKVGKAKTKYFRTDGFYLFDNGLDTIITIPDGMEMQVQMIKYMQEKGLIPLDRKFTHDDSVAKNSEGSTEIHCIAFFNDTSGTVCGTIYRNSDVVSEFLKTIKERKEKIGSNADIDRMVRLSDFTSINDSTFIFTRGRNFDFCEEKYRCICRNGNLFVKMEKPKVPGLDVPVRNYIFVPFNNIPSDLLHVKKRM